MRINLRKFIVIGCGLGLIWLIASYSSFIQMPVSGSKHSIKDLENKIDELQEKLQYQISDSNNLLAKLRQKLKKTEKQKLDYQNSHEDDVDIQRRITNPILPILVIACDRVTVKRCLEKLVDYRPNKDTFPIIISQDCGHNATYQVIKSFTENDPSVTVVQQPDLSEIALPKEAVKFKGYYKISRHYRFALNHVFKTLKHDAVIIVEDDLDIAPDFYDYFLGTYPLLYKDRSIWCISAWNDNGKRELIDSSQPELLHRTDFFPGLGWVLRRETWLQLEPIWPQAYFDDWLRDPENTQGRSCIRPEISRTYNFGKVGVSKGLFFDRHLKSMKLNMDPVDFTKLNLTYLIKDIYDDRLTSLVYSLPEVLPEDVISGSLTHNTVRVTYTSAKTYQRAAKKMGLMDDFRSGIPRTAYRGIVTCFIRGRRVYLAPSEPWTHYDPHWGR